MAMHHNDGKHIENIVFETKCGRHNADRGNPCWAIESDVSDNSVVGVCGKRIKSAGFDGKISDQSTLKTGARNGKAKRS